MHDYSSSSHAIKNKILLENLFEMWKKLELLIKVAYFKSIQSTFIRHFPKNIIKI